MGTVTTLKLKQQIVEVGRRVYERGFVAATDGNISIRDSQGMLWITPSGSCLGELRIRDLVPMDSSGAPLRSGRPSSEFALHVAVYAQRPDAHAVLHAHPPMATALTLARQSRLLSEPVLPEVILGLGSVPTTEYATPASEESAQVIRDLITRHDTLLLDRHGSVTIGSDVWQAYRKLERLEHAAQILVAARSCGELPRLSADEIARLETVRERLNRLR